MCFPRAFICGFNEIVEQRKIANPGHSEERRPVAGTTPSKTQDWFLGWHAPLTKTLFNTRSFQHYSILNRNLLSQQNISDKILQENETHSKIEGCIFFRDCFLSRFCWKVKTGKSQFWNQSQFHPPRLGIWLLTMMMPLARGLSAFLVLPISAAVGARP